jgi:hypothetical protein
LAAEGLWIFCLQGALEGLEGLEGQGVQVGQVGLGHLWHLEGEKEREREREGEIGKLLSTKTDFPMTERTSEQIQRPH